MLVLLAQNIFVKIRFEDASSRDASPSAAAEADIPSKLCPLDKLYGSLEGAYLDLSVSLDLPCLSIHLGGLDSLKGHRESWSSGAEKSVL